MRSSHSRATLSGSGAPAEIVVRRLERSVSASAGECSMRATIVGTPPSTVALVRSASASERSASKREWWAMISAAPVRSAYRHISPAPCVIGESGSMRSSGPSCSRLVKPSKVSCFRRAVSEASFERPVVPEVSAIWTTRSGSGSAKGPSSGSPSVSRSSSSPITSFAPERSIASSVSSRPRLTGSGSSVAPMAGTAISSAT